MYACWMGPAAAAKADEHKWLASSSKVPCAALQIVHLLILTALAAAGEPRPPITTNSLAQGVKGWQHADRWQAIAKG